MTPDFRIRANGADITAIIRERLVALTTTDALDEESDTCELTIDARPGIAPPSTGVVLDLELGYRESGLALMGSYTVAEIERTGPPDVLTARGAAADLLGGLKAPRTRSWDFPTIGALVAEIAGEHGLVPQVEPSLRGVVLPHIDQISESDLNLLRRLADQQVDVVAKPANGRLLFVRRQALAAAEAQRGPAIRILRTETVQYRLTRADRGEYAAVTAQWHDVSTAEPQTVTVGEEDGQVFALPQLFPDEASAHNAAATKLRELQRGTGTGEVTLALGRPGLAADAPILLDGWGEGIDGSWVATRVEHSLSGSGLRSRLEIEPVTTPWERASSSPDLPVFSGGAQFKPAPGSSSVPAPNRLHLVQRVAAEHPAELAAGSYEFLDLVVAELRKTDPRWGYNCKRGDCSDISEDVVTYYLGDGDPVNGNPDVAIIDVIAGYKGPDPQPAWTDLTEATRRAGTIGRWKYPRVVPVPPPPSPPV